MTDINKGIKITSAIVPTAKEDKYPTHIAEYGKGGHVTVSSITDFINNYPLERMTEGMTVYSQLDQVMYVLKDWTSTSGRPSSSNVRPLLGGSGEGGVNVDQRTIGSATDRWAGYFNNLNTKSLSLGESNSNLEDFGIQKRLLKLLNCM